MATTHPSGEGYKTEEPLREMYHDEGLSAQDIGERFGVSHNSILYWMDKFGIDRRRPHETHRMKGNYLSRTTHPTFHDRPDGYVRVESTYKGEESSCFVHQLVAIADGADPRELFGGEKIVHHVNGIKWDNRPENLEAMDKSDHGRHHWPG